MIWPYLAKSNRDFDIERYEAALGKASGEVSSSLAVSKAMWSQVAALGKSGIRFESK